MPLRTSNIEKLRTETFDALIIGGGINGAVAAASLAGKGGKVALIDQGDFASFTSQESSNLAWGGIKYLETFEFGLVRKLCMSRNHLIENYPSTVQEIRFLATISKGFRFHPLFLYLGGLLYWLIGNFFTRAPRYLSARKIGKIEPVINTENAKGGFEYSDAYLHDNDARFVFGFIRRALSSGCIATNYVEALDIEKVDKLWTTTARNVINGEEFQIESKVLINATGPFADQLNKTAGENTKHHHVLSKGVHFLVDRVSPNNRVLAFFADDGRLFFVIPMGPKTCIGTTDTRVENPVTRITNEDRDFVLRNINAKLNLDKPLTEADIVAQRCGVRPLVVSGSGDSDQDWTQLSRKHAIEVNKDSKYISIFGGKLTDCLNVGDEVSHSVQKLGVKLPHPKYRWYGEPAAAIHDEFLHEAGLMDLDSYTDPEASELLSSRLWRRYGAQAIVLLENIRENPERAEVLIKGTEYIRCEIEQAARREMIVKLEDFLRRRSKIALVGRTEEIKNSPGLMEACEVLFGDKAQEKFDEYFVELGDTTNI